jgi:AspT/YidE/YbjL antiporter-like protein
LGYAVGNIQIAGFSLGVGAVLFVGLLIGVIAPKSAPPGFVGTLGLVLFLYGIGIQYGVDFFRGLASPAGIKANVLGLVAVLAGVFATILCVRYMGVGMDFALGIFAGSLTSTGSLQAATSAVGNQNRDRDLRTYLQGVRADSLLLSVQPVAAKVGARAEGLATAKFPRPTNSGMSIATPTQDPAWNSSPSAGGHERAAAA